MLVGQIFTSVADIKLFQKQQMAWGPAFGYYSQISIFIIC